LFQFQGEGQKKPSHKKRKVERMVDDRHSDMAAAKQVAMAMAHATAKKNVVHRSNKLTRLAPGKLPILNLYREG